MIINPEYAAATEISRILRFPSAIKIDPFAKGKVELLKFKVKPEFKLDGLSVMDIDSQFRCDVLIGGVERGDEVAIPDGKFVIKNGDMVSIIASPANSAEFFRQDRHPDKPGQKYDDCRRRYDCLLSGETFGCDEDPG